MSSPGDLFRLDGRTAVVTGGTRGIGMMMARGLLDAGARVLVASRKGDAVAQAVAALGGHGDVAGRTADLSTPEGCTAFADEVRGWTDQLHVLVNNAGATWGEPLDSFPVSGWDKVLDLNLRAPFLLTQALLPLLEATGTADDPARVINVGSIDGLRVPLLPTWSYSASKAGLHHLTRHLAAELGPRHVTVNAVAPGPFESRMMAATLERAGDQIAAAAPLRRIGRPDDMAGVCVYLASRAGALRHRGGAPGRRRPGDDGLRPPTAGHGRDVGDASRGGAASQRRRGHPGGQPRSPRGPV